MEQGFKYEFGAIYYNGPADGLRSYVFSNNENIPPYFVFLELFSLINLKTPLGSRLLAHKNQQEVRVACYELIPKPQFNRKKDSLIYTFSKMANIKEFERLRKN